MGGGAVIGVVVLSKDRPDLFARCAASVHPDDPVCERVLVQNGTDRQTLEAAKLAGWRVIEPGKNLSFSAANNLAVQSMDRTRVTHALLVNNDCVLHPRCVEHLWAARLDAEAVGCVVLDPWGLVNHAGSVPRHHGGMDHLGRGLPQGLFSEDVLGLPAVTFAAVLVSLAAWDLLGGMDEGYWYCFEDVDWCLRLRESGGRVRVAAGAVVTHDESSTRCPFSTAGSNLEKYRRDWPLERIWAALRNGPVPPEGRYHLQAAGQGAGPSWRVRLLPGGEVEGIEGRWLARDGRLCLVSRQLPGGSGVMFRSVDGVYRGERGAVVLCPV